MNRLLTASLLVILAVGAIGCGHHLVSMSHENRSYTESDYDDVYANWTRAAHPFAFGQMQDVLAVTGTFESWDFRWAYIARYGHDFGLNTNARTALLFATLADARVHHRFFVTLAGRVWRESDLTSAQSAWRVMLVDESGRITMPLEIERVPRPTPAERVYFPSVSPQRQTFRVIFAANGPDGVPTISDDAHFVILRFTGPEGTVDLRWDFEHE